MDETNQPIEINISDLYSNLNLRILIDSIAEGLVVINKNGIVVLVNKNAEKMFGIEKKHFIGKPLDLIIPPNYSTIHQSHIEDFFRHPLPRPMGSRGIELFGKRSDGFIFPVEVSLSHLKTLSGEVSLGFVTDISARKLAEEALQERNKELDAYAHTVAHDLNSTLTGVIGFSELLLNDLDRLSKESQIEYLRVINQSGYKMGSIIKELLLFASMGKNEIPLKGINMMAVVQEAIFRLQMKIEESKTEISYPKKLLPAKGYGPWVEEIWYNYISNAIKYGGSPPKIEIFSQPAEDEYIQFCVKDNGIGISPEKIDNIFNNQNHALPEKGYGLGLCIVKRIILKLNGKINIESEPGKGSVFSFYLKKDD